MSISTNIHNTDTWAIFIDAYTYTENFYIHLFICISYTQACAYYAGVITELLDVHSGIEGWSSC